MAAAFDARKATMLPGDPISLAGNLSGSGNEGGYAFSASDAGALTYLQTARRRRLQLTWVDRNGRVQAVVGGAQTQVFPELSPDGARVAVARVEPGPGTGGQMT